VASAATGWRLRRRPRSNLATKSWQRRKPALKVKVCRRWTQTSVLTAGSLLKRVGELVRIVVFV